MSEEVQAAVTEVEAVHNGGTTDTPVETTAESTAETPVENTVENTVEVSNAATAEVSTESAAIDTADDAPASDSSADDNESISIEVDGRVVRLLAIGQQVTGLVKRVTEFGAFVDIGVGRDGLVHISELSVRRIGKVADVLKEGQEIAVWIKKLDRDRNRISLSMIEPGTKTIRDLEKGELIQGTVTRILPYGAFVDIGVGRDALLHIREMSERYIAKPEDVVTVGDVIEARIIELSRRRQRVDLSMKGLRPEPEPEPVAAPVVQQGAPAPAPEPEEEADEFADMEVLTPMEMAFKRAMEAEGIKVTVNDKKNRNNKKGKRGNRSLQDEIIARTLQVAGKQ
jgi:small subunit ribosomal protein S1